MPRKKRLFPTGKKPEMVNYQFSAVCTETTSWEQKVVVSIPEGVTDKQLEALGQVLLRNEDEIKEMGFFVPYEENEDFEIEISEGEPVEDSKESLPCRLNVDGGWEIEGIHRED